MGGEESSTGHQLLSDYIIPDIKTTHTQPGSPPGAAKGGRGRSWANLAPKPIPIFHPAPAGGRGNGPRCPRSLGAAPRIRVLRRGEPGARRPGGCAAGPQRRQPMRGRWAGRLRSIPRLRASPAAYLCGVALGSGAHSHGPLSALLRRGPGGSGGSAAGPGSSWASRSAEGAAPVSPARQPGPSLAGAGGGFVCARGVLGALRL